MEDLIGKQFGTYQIISQCGQGGMATVYKAYQPSMDRYVALKVLPRFHSSDPEFLGRFEQEAKALAQLQHPHILPVFDYGESEGYTYFVMPLMQDGNLAELLVEQKLSLYRINQIITQIGGALEFAHSSGFIHRDVKPSNILLDASGNCMLMDFGIAKIIEGSKVFTQTGGILGTPAYMSPEQGSGQKIDHRSDIYSLGIILYEMVTGRPPYEAETPVAVIFKHVHDPLPPPSTLVPDLAGGIEKVILKSLVKDPEERYQTVREMIDVLSRVVSTTLHREATMVVSPPTVQESVSDFEETVVGESEEEATAFEIPQKVLEEKFSSDSDRIDSREKPPYLRTVLYIVGAVALVLIGVWLANSGLFTDKESEAIDTLTAEISPTEILPVTETSIAVVIPTDISATNPPEEPSPTQRPTLTPPPPYASIPTLDAPGTGLEVVIFLGFDPYTSPFDDVRVRRAIASAIDRDRVIEIANTNQSGRSVVPATSFIPVDILGFDLYGEVGYLYNRDTAHRFLAEAGYPNGEGFPTITLHHRANEGSTALAIEIAASLSENLGISVNTSVHDDFYNNLPEFYVMGWLADYLDPHGFLHDPFCGEIDAGYVGSEDYYTKVEAINHEGDRRIRNSLIKEFSSIFCMHLWDPHLPLGEEYKGILDLALEEDDDNVARLLFVDAEIILVESETLVVPIYHRSN